MNTQPGLRERKKQRTRQALYDAAMQLFVERGFENVTLTDIAEAADVSKMTVLNYFPTKDDIVFARYDDIVEQPAAVVAARHPGESAVAALRRAFLDALARHDPSTGLNNNVTTFFRLVLGSPSLLRRQMEVYARSEDVLARRLAEETGADPDDITPKAAASLIIALQRALVSENCLRLVAGQSADDVQPFALSAANRAFDLLESGLGGYCTGRGEQREE